MRHLLLDNMLFKCVRAHIHKKADLRGNAGRGKDSQDRVKRPWIAPGDPVQSCLSQNRDVPTKKSPRHWTKMVIFQPIRRKAGPTGEKQSNQWEDEDVNWKNPTNKRWDNPARSADRITERCSFSGRHFLSKYSLTTFTPSLHVHSYNLSS